MKAMRRAWSRVVAASLLVVATGFVACATSGMTREEKAAQKLRVAQAVADSLAERHFSVDVNYVTPQRMPGHNLTYGYGVRVKGDVIESYLPFFGRVYRAEFGEQTGLNFTDRILDYRSGVVKKGRYAVELVVRRRLETLIYRFDIFENGKTTIMVRSDNRDTMTFSGEMNMEVP